MTALLTAAWGNSRRWRQRSNFSQRLLTERLRYVGDGVLLFNDFGQKANSSLTGAIDRLKFTSGQLLFLDRHTGSYSGSFETMIWRLVLLAGL
jgi:hypothetical protein